MDPTRLCQLVFTHVLNHRIWCGPLSDQRLHLYLLLLLLPLLVQEVLQEEWLFLQEERPWFVLILVLDLLLAEHSKILVLLGGRP